MKLKKLKKLWGERKKIWREYRTAFLIEIIFLCVAITATGLLIRMSQKGWEEKLQLMTKNVQNLVESNLDTRKAETETQLKNTVIIGLKNFMPESSFSILKDCLENGHIVRNNSEFDKLIILYHQEIQIWAKYLRIFFFDYDNVIYNLLFNIKLYFRIRLYKCVFQFT